MTVGKPRILSTLALVSILCVASHAAAQDLRPDYFESEFWCDLQPMVEQPGETYPVPKDKAVTQVLTEASYAFSGMIYGFHFVYSPGDRGRGVRETFDLAPISQIHWGDSHLTVHDTRVEGSHFIARIVYSLAPFQESWTQSWDSNIYPEATGTGEGNYYLGFDEKMASYRDAIKGAIRDYVRLRVFNRPKGIEGDVVLRGTPYTIVDGGKWITTLSVKLKIDKITPYLAY